MGVRFDVTILFCCADALQWEVVLFFVDPWQ
jgi:hypothetical protein